MAEATNYLEGAIAEHICNVNTFAAVSGAAIGLATAVTDVEAGTLTECANSFSYGREAISTTQMENTATNGVLANDVAITFTTASGGSWGTVTHAFIADSATYGAGNILAITTLDASKTVGDGDTFEFAIGDFSVTVT
jgi:hypothetical protein